jgi:hypothetical protein
MVNSLGEVLYAGALDMFLLAGFNLLFFWIVAPIEITISAGCKRARLLWMGIPAIIVGAEYFYMERFPSGLLTCGVIISVVSVAVLKYGIDVFLGTFVFTCERREERVCGQFPE